MVQNEMQRRANLYSSKSTSRYSSEYALTGKVICGECGSKYRRVTKSKRGKKKIVWRCIERLNNGTRNCRQSPTILEETLHNAILNSIMDILKNSEDVKETVKREIEAIIFKDDEYNMQVIKANIRKHEKELNMLRNILKETEDREFYVSKMCIVESQITELNEKLKYAGSPDDVMMKHIEEIIDSTDLNMNEYFNQIVRTVIECVIIINEARIKIKYVDGTEVNVGL